MMCRCNSCGATFEIYLIKAKKGDIEAQFFKCPNCEQVYPVLFTDSELRSCIKRNMPKKDMANRIKQLEEQYHTDLVRFEGWRIVQ